MRALPPGSVVLRPAGPSDCHCIADILIDARKAFMPYAPSAHAEADVHDWVAAVLVPGGGVTVATGDDAVVGVMAVSRRDGLSWIEPLSVTPRLVGQGVATTWVPPALVSGDNVVIRWIFQFEWLDGSSTRMEELAYQRWNGEQIAEEQFFYDPAQLAPLRAAR